MHGKGDECKGVLGPSDSGGEYRMSITRCMSESTWRRLLEIIGGRGPTRRMENKNSVMQSYTTCELHNQIIVPT